MNGLFATAKEPFPQAQELFPLLRITLAVAHPFFMGHGQFMECIPDALPGDLEMPRPFCLGPIRMRCDMLAQRVPIQFTRPLRAGTLVADATGLEPAIDARLTHLEPPSRFGLATPTAPKIHHPLTQI